MRNFIPTANSAGHQGNLTARIASFSVASALPLPGSAANVPRTAQLQKMSKPCSPKYDWAGVLFFAPIRVRTFVFSGCGLDAALLRSGDLMFHRSYLH